MKKATGTIILFLLFALFIPGAANAASLGVTPSSFTITIPENGSNTMGFQFFGYTGTVELTPVNIPVDIYPSVIQVSEDTGRIILTFRSTDGEGRYVGNLIIRGANQGNVALSISVNATVILSGTVVPPPAGGGGGGGGGGYVPVPTPTPTPTIPLAPATTPTSTSAPTKTTATTPTVVINPTATPTVKLTPTAAVPSATISATPTTPATTATPIRGQTGWWWFWVIIAGVVLLVIIGLFIWRRRRNYVERSD